MPKDTTALSMLANNQLINNGEYKEDGWIYVDGKRVKKWFKQYYPDMNNTVRLWPPVLDDLQKLETRYVNMISRTNKFYNETYKPLFNKLLQVGKAHAEPIYNHKRDGKWWLYKMKSHNDFDYISFDWVDAPSKPLNHELGQQYYLTEHRLYKYYSYNAKFRGIMAVAIDRFLDKNCSDRRKADAVLRLSINDRDYWYRCRFNQYGVLVWTKIVWTVESDIIEISL